MWSASVNVERAIPQGFSRSNSPKQSSHNPLKIRRLS
jgi:hypothetical protein